VKFGLTHANIGRFSDPGPAVELAQAAERAGFDSLWTVEHVILPTKYEPLYPETPDGRFPFDVTESIADPLVWMAFVASSTEQIKLGTAILIVPQRNPLIMAKEAASLDRLSGGRLLLGVGAGWLREEFAALGVDFDSRGPRLTESIEAMRALWAGGPATFTGPSTSFDGVISHPRPVQPSVPVHVGGFTVPAAVRAGRIGDGFFPGGYDERERLAMLVKRARQEAEDCGRDPDQLEITARWTKKADDLDDLDMLRRLEDLGVHRVVVPAWVFDTGDLRGALERVGERVFSQFAPA
jgi:probable F420-dependent oxidoreductase